MNPRTLIYYILSCSLLILYSCKKEPIDDFKNKIIGDWKYEKVIQKEFNSKGKLLSETTIATTEGAYYHFKSDVTAIQYFDMIANVTHHTYKVVSENRFELNTGVVNPCRVELIDKSSFVFTVEGLRRGEYDYTEYTHYLRK